MMIWHCESFDFDDAGPATRPAGIAHHHLDGDDLSPSPSIVAFACIERGDSQSAAENAAQELVRYADFVGKKSRIVVVPFGHLSAELACPQDALGVLQSIKSRLGSHGHDAHLAPFGSDKRLRMTTYAHPGAVAYRLVA
ncbi:MAG: threonyl-tRNA synthetase editing domain-containing protein [Actinomycetota bacterium]